MNKNDVTLFKRFLKERGAYAQYFQNFKRGEKWRSQDPVMRLYYHNDKFFDKFPNTFYVMNAFYWEGTMEGYDFWQAMATDWSRIIRYLKYGEKNKDTV